MKKWPVVLLILLFVAIMALRGVPYLINVYLNQNADRIVSDMITRTSGFDNHEVSFGNIRLDYNYTGTYLNIEDVVIKPTSDIDVTQSQIELKLGLARITGFTWSSFLFNNSIKIDSAKLENLDIKTVTPPIDSLNIETSGEKGDKKDYDMISANKILLNHFNLENRDLKCDSVRMKITDLRVEAADFRLSKEDIDNQDALFDVGMVHGEIEDVSVHFDDYKQHAKIKDLMFDTRDKTVKVADFSLNHKLGKFEYTESFKLRTPWLELTNGVLDVKGVNFDSFLRKGILDVDSLKISELQIEAFNNKNRPEDHERRPSMVHDMFQTIEFPMVLRNIDLVNAHIKIEEQPDNGAPTTGKLFFSDVNAQISRLSNLEDDIETAKNFEIIANALLMGKGKVYLEASYDLEDPSGKFHLRGSLGKMDLTAINPMIEPEAKVSLKSGIINRLDFNIYANDDDGHGEVIVRYEDLQIEILNRDFEKDKNIFRKIGSFLASKVVIKSQNPRKNGNLEKGVVYAKRVKHKSMFHFWWQLIFSGLKSTVTGEDLEDLKSKAND
ncbi:hypothetical protein ACFOUP_08320 [Belliella kenyensis]|uniref:DUF748 domain-containing protein n=1 Tax=Belliella kenyensis TaxID=1472724 RepID=A0ABV8EJ92_9BACT|nr:hypothetical protein [Belliella kenyensis]MCH7403310.1 hypothetical protein [Belliella kenyensis]MDN3602951.1 hypothetical protein [Belliella kenyensis]